MKSSIWYLAVLPYSKVPTLNKTWRFGANLRYESIKTDIMFARLVSMAELLQRPFSSRYFWINPERTAWAPFRRPADVYFGDPNHLGLVTCKSGCGPESNDLEVRSL